MRKKALQQFVHVFAKTARALPRANAVISLDLPVSQAQSLAALSLKSMACRWGAIRFPLSMAVWCLHKADYNERRAKAVLLAMLVHWTTEDHKELTLDAANAWLPGHPTASFWEGLENGFGDLSHFAGKMTINDFNFMPADLDMPVEFRPDVLFAG